MNSKKKIKSAEIKPRKPRSKEETKERQAKVPEHKELFEQLLDDAVLGVKKK